MVLEEDIAAMLGLVFALVAVILSAVTGNPVYDAIGSIIIGALLITISFVLGIKVKSLLIGQSADDPTRTAIKLFLEVRPEVEQLQNLITFQMGPRIMVAVKARMKPADTVEQLITRINVCEVKLRKQFPAIQWVFFEPDIEK